MRQRECKRRKTLLTCSRTFEFLLCKPASLKNRSHIIYGVSGPFPVSFCLSDPCNDDDAPVLKARPPSITMASRALSRMRSRLSPSRSRRPPEGRNAVRICLKVTESTTAVVDSSDELVVARRKNGGNAFNVGVVRCWFGDFKQDLSALTSPSKSAI